MWQKIQEHENVINCDDRCFLVTSRPGRGKTSVALRFAGKVLNDGSLKQSQKVLFLTFSRNAVYQISIASQNILIEPSIREHLRICTYHSFMWWLLQVFGRFAGLPRALTLIWETKARAVSYKRDFEQQTLPLFLACEAKGITYDCFAPLCIKLLKSDTIKRSLAELYPIIVVDEFQDTNNEQWEIIKSISEYSKLCCFADRDQMIHRFRGATDNRIDIFFKEKNAIHHPLQKECLRTGEHHLLDFAETILDNRKVSAKLASVYKKRFLKNHFGPNARSSFLKITLTEFYTDYGKRKLQGFPSIALAAYANNSVVLIRKELLQTTGRIPKSYTCKILEPDFDESVEDLIIHLAYWISSKSKTDLEIALKIIGSLIAPADIDNASIPTQSLFFPEKLLSKEIPLKGSANTIVTTIEEYESDTDTCSDVIRETANLIFELGDKVKSLGNKLEKERVKEKIEHLECVCGSCHGDGAYKQLCLLENKVNNERQQRCILQRVVPIKGRVVATMHKLKGKEFDYVALVTMPGEKFFKEPDETELDARRLLYVGLTRARYDARILYLESNPPPILKPFL
jgi:DNA helicase-2/ATP-dependent DNA helicase PcrA